MNIDILKAHIQKGDIVIDLRSNTEFTKNHIPGSVNMKYENILSSIKKYTNDKSKKILLFCSSGIKSKIAYNLLTSFGYTNVIDIGKINM